MTAAPTTLNELEELIVQQRHNRLQGRQFQNEGVDYEIHQVLARVSVRHGRKPEIMRQIAQGLPRIEPAEKVAFAQKGEDGVYVFVDEFDAHKAAIFYAMKDRLSHSTSHT